MHPYAEFSIFIRDQQCSGLHVEYRWYPTLWVGQIADSALSAAAHPQDTVARRSSRSARIGLALFPLTRAGLPLRSWGRRDTAAAARWGIAKSLDIKRCIGSAC